MANGNIQQQHMEHLLEALASTLGTSVEVIRNQVESDGEVPKGAASVLNVARQFLNDNGVQVDPSTNEDIKRLEKSLPDFDEDDVIPINREG